VLQQGLQLALENLVEVTSIVGWQVGDLAQLLHTLSEEPQFLEQLLKDLDVLIVDWLMEEVVEAESTGNDQHQTLVELGCDFEQDFVVVGEVERVVLDVVDHAGLLVVEEFPDLEHVLEVVPGDLVEVALLGRQFLLILLFKHLEVKIQKSLNFGSVFGLQTVDVGEQIFEGAHEPLVQLGPVGGEVLFHEDARHPDQLVVGILPQNAVLWVLNQMQDLGLQVLLEFGSELALLINGRRHALQVDQRIGDLRRPTCLGLELTYTGVSFATAVSLEKSGEGVLHKDNGLVLNHLVILVGAGSLSIVAGNNVEEHLLVLGEGFALLGQELLSLVPEVLIQRQGVGHSGLNLLNCEVHLL
jgi:hypothetical protein